MNWFVPQLKSYGTGADFSVSDYEYATSKVVCVGRNYQAHAAELNNPVPKEPLLFIKPNSCLTPLESIQLPRSESSCHHELEVALLISERLSNASTDQVMSAITGIGLALDLTLREVQSELKAKGHPWEKAKAFDDSCPVSHFEPVSAIDDLDLLDFGMTKNGDWVQRGEVKDMIFNIPTLLQDISSHFTLMPGDIVLTGTPEGVGPLTTGDELAFYLNGKQIAVSQVA